MSRQGAWIDGLEVVRRFLERLAEFLERAVWKRTGMAVQDGERGHGCFDALFHKPGKFDAFRLAVSPGHDLLRRDVGSVRECVFECHAAIISRVR